VQYKHHLTKEKYRSRWSNNRFGCIS